MYIIPFNIENSEFILSRLKEKWGRPRRAYIPRQIEGYNEWHQTIDEICWLFKVCYTPKEDVRKKRFRLDRIFHNYLTMHNITLSKVAAIFLSNQNPNTRVITDDLKRGWYNELSYSVPLKKSSLGLSFRDIELNKPITDMRFTFPSWQITSAYYSVYFYLRSITLQKQDNFNLQEHGTTISCFKNNVLNPLERVIWQFPLNISYAPGTRVARRKLLINRIEHLNYRYSRHPRAPYASPSQLFEEIYKVFRKRAKGRKKPTKYTIFDYLHDFRVWANYLDIDNLLNLWGSGYKGFIDQNLSLLMFFIGGISEICYMSVFGPKQYLRNLQHLYDLFACNNPQLQIDFVNSPPYQRLIIFKEMGLVGNTINLKPQYNINEVSLA